MRQDELGQLLSQMVPPVDETGVWESIEQRAGREQKDAGSPILTSDEWQVTGNAQPAQPRRISRSRRLIGLAAAAVIVLVALGFGVNTLVEQLGQRNNVVVITDDSMSPGSGSGETVGQDFGAVPAEILNPEAVFSDSDAVIVGRIEEILPIRQNPGGTEDDPAAPLPVRYARARIEVSQSFGPERVASEIVLYFLPALALEMGEDVLLPISRFERFGAALGADEYWLYHEMTAFSLATDGEATRALSSGGSAEHFGWADRYQTKSLLDLAARMTGTRSDRLSVRHQTVSSSTPSGSLGPQELHGGSPAEAWAETTTTYGGALATDDPALSSTTTTMGVGPILSWAEEAVLAGRTIKVEQPVEVPEQTVELPGQGHGPDETGAPAGSILLYIAYSLVTITNTGNESLTCAAAEFFLMGNKSGSSGIGGREKTLGGHEVLDLVTLQPGESVTRAVLFQIRQGDHPVKVLLGTRLSTGSIHSSTSEWLACWQ